MRKQFEQTGEQVTCEVKAKIQKKILLIVSLNIINMNVFFLINVIRGLIIESQVKDEKYHAIKMVIFFL